MSTREQFQGCLLGLALGDALGAPFEGGPLERLLWTVIGKTADGRKRWTDDTQMTVDLIESFLAVGQIDQDDLATRFARSYRWSRGYGPGAARLLKRIARGTDWRTANRSVYREGSFGNGAAMRSAILGLIYRHEPDEALVAARATAIVTHAHPIAVEGAMLLAKVTRLVALGEDNSAIMQQAVELCAREELRTRLTLAAKWIKEGAPIPERDVSRHLGRGIAAHQSCVTAVYLALRFRHQPFAEMHAFITRIGGDADTIGAMAGAVWGTANGVARLPGNELTRLEQRERLLDLAMALDDRVGSS